MENDNFSIDPKLEELSEKWQKNPKSRAFAPLADAYRKSGMLEEALNVCLEGLKVHSDYISAHIVLGKIYLDKQMDKEAETEFRGVIEKDPDNLVTLNYLGEIYQKQRRYVEALEKFERVRKLDPFNEQIKRKCGELAKYGAGEPVIKPVAPAATPEPGKVDMEAGDEKPAPPEKTPPPATAPEKTPPASVFELDSEEETEKVEPRPAEEKVFEVEPVISAAPSTPPEIEGEQVFNISDDLEDADSAPSATSESAPEKVPDVTEKEEVKSPAPPHEASAGKERGDSVAPLDSVLPQRDLPGSEPVKETPVEQPDVLEAADDKIFDITEDEDELDAEQEVQEEAGSPKVYEITEEPEETVPASETAGDKVFDIAEEEAAKEEPEASVPGEKVFDISEDIEPLDKITFSTTPFPEEKPESTAGGSREVAGPAEAEKVEAVEEEIVPEAVEAEERETAPPMGLKEVPREEEQEFPPTALATEDVDVSPGKSEEHEVETVTMARIYAKQGMINKAKVICLKLLSLDPANREAKGLLLRLQVADEGQPLPDAEEIPSLADKEDEPLIDFRDNAPDDESFDRAQTIFVGDLAEEEEDEPYRGTMMDIDFGASGGEEESAQEQKSDIKSWIDQVKSEEDEE